MIPLTPSSNCEPRWSDRMISGVIAYLFTIAAIAALGNDRSGIAHSELTYRHKAILSRRWSPQGKILPEFSSFWRVDLGARV
jgi:hypothetical protein